MRHASICAALALMPWSIASAQGPSDVRWRLVDGDTIAEVPYATVLEWATYRTVEREALRHAAIRITVADGLIDAQRTENDALHAAMDAQSVALATSRAAYVEVRDDLIDCGKQGNRLRTWATIGKVELALFAAAAALALAL